jgi:hypothetical protein
MVKIYFKVCLFVISVIATFGFLLPYLFSVDSDFAVLTGVCALILSIPLFFLLGRNIYKDINITINRKSDK